jgi:uncharacterized protein YdaU (DUF1376 family)
MKDSPAFDFFPSDWLSGTLLMTHEEKGLYIDLLAMQWENGELPSDLSRIRCKPATLRAVLEKFPVCEDGKRRNTRLESERKKQRDRIAKSRAVGLAGAKGRWAGRNADAMPTHSERNADAMPTHSERNAYDGNANAMPTTHHSPLITVLLEKEPKGDAVASDLPKASKPAKLERPDEVPEQVWTDFLAHRKRKKADVTATAMAAIRREADKAEMDLATALETIVARGWTGLNHEWLKQASSTSQGRDARQAAQDTIILEFEQFREPEAKQGTP